MAKETVVTKQFTFNIAANQDSSVELIQLISLAIQSYEPPNKQSHALPCDIVSVIKYFASSYGVKL